MVIRGKRFTYPKGVNLKGWASGVVWASYAWFPIVNVAYMRWTNGETYTIASNPVTVWVRRRV